MRPLYARALTACGALLCLVACDDGIDAPASDALTDGRDDVALSGKADGGFSACQVDLVLAFLNDPATTAEAIKAVGVHTRAARNLATPENRPYADLLAVDAVYYVGPVAMEQLGAWAAPQCETPEPSEAAAEVIFSPQSWSQSHLARVVELIEQTETSIDIAMYSFRDASIMDALEDAVGRGVTVRFLFESAADDRKDPEGTRSAALEDMGIEVRYVNKIMHHKFAIFDGPRTDLAAAETGTLATGSGNWSNSAGTRYDENTLFVEGDARLLLAFQQEFDLLWDNSRPVIWNEDIPPVPSVPVDDAEIAAAEGSDAWFTSDNFKTYVSNTYGPTFSTISGKDAVADELVALIAGAEQSIWIASGHLRSRPIAEALMARAGDGLDIRVLLDGQEYVSLWAHNKQLGEQADCLEAAGTSASKIRKCLDKGFRYGYAVHEAGIALRYKYYAYRWDYSYAVQMHHKYLIVDGATVATGSYNYSDNAEHNTFENVTVLTAARYPALVQAYLTNFLSLWDQGRAEGHYDALMEDVAEGSDPFPIVFEPVALVWEEVDALKDAMSAACPDINSEPFRTDPASHQTCYPQ